MELNHKFAGIAAFGALCGSILGVFAAQAPIMAEQKALYTKERIRIISNKRGEGILKTFQTANGELSYLLEEKAEKSIEEIIFYMERLNEKPLVLNELTAIYKVVDYNHDNQITLLETNPLKTELREKYITAAWRILKNDQSKRH